MRIAIHEFLDQMAKLFGVSKEAFEQGLFSALVVGFLFAGVHLLTMVITRWGDHNATSKSLLFSFLVHVSCGIGMLVFAPDPVFQVEDSESDPMELQSVIVEGEEQTRIDESGNTPVWEELPDMKRKTLARLEREPEKMELPQVPDQKRDMKTLTELEYKETPRLPDETISLPQKMTNAQIDELPKESALPMKAENPEWETGPKVAVPSMTSLRRQKIQRNIVEKKISRFPKLGGVDRSTPKFKTSPKLKSIETTLSPDSQIKRNPTSDDNQITRREGPAPIMTKSDLVGRKEGVNNGGGPNVAPKSPRLSRTRMKVRDNSSESTLTRKRSSVQPSLPKPSRPIPIASIRSPNSMPSPDVMTPNLQRPDFNAIRRDEAVKMPATYRLRNLARRREIAREFGGTDASERAVEASLKWFASIQEPEGFWDGSKHGSGTIKIDDDGIDRANAGLNADTGLTALTVLAFLGAGYTNEEGKYATQVDKALKWLIKQQQDDGFLGGNATAYARMYCHGMTTYALAESYGMLSDPSSDPQLRLALEKAVAYIVKLQKENDGGWRYWSTQNGDMSMFGWQLMALKSAEIAGIPIPKSTRQRMLVFLKNRSRGTKKGLAGYREEGVPTPVMTAEALFCKQMLGIKRSDPQSKQAIEFVMQNQPRASKENLYYWYYGTLAMYQYGGEPWKQWNENLRELLVKGQVKSGAKAGSWEPRGPWGGYGGRIYSTAVATLSLEVYYRFLPLYQMGGRYE